MKNVTIYGYGDPRATGKAQVIGNIQFIEINSKGEYISYHTADSAYAATGYNKNYDKVIKILKALNIGQSYKLPDEDCIFVRIA